MNVAGFDWDDGNLSKCQKHGVSIEEIEQLLAGTPRIAPDLAHSDDESRFIAIGRIAKGGLFLWLSPFGRVDGSNLFGRSARATCIGKKVKHMIKSVPKLTTDEDAERFLDQDLSGLDFTQFQPAQFEFEAKSERVNMRLPKALLSAVKEKAAIAGVPYQRFIRQALERAVVQDKAPDKTAQRTRSAR